MRSPPTRGASIRLGRPKACANDSSSPSHLLLGRPPGACIAIYSEGLHRGVGPWPPHRGGLLAEVSSHLREVVHVALHVIDRVLDRQRPVLLRAGRHQDAPVALVKPA